MAYNGAYLSQRFFGSPAGRSVYFYTTTDVHTDVDASGYFSDGVSSHKMKIGDVVFVTVVDSLTNPTSVTSTTWHHVSGVNGDAATVSVAQSGAIADEVVLSYPAYTVVTAGTTLRFVAPFNGVVAGVRAISNGVITGTDKFVRLVISGQTVTSGTLTIENGQAAGAKFASAPTTGNAITEGNTIALQTGGQKASGSTVNFFVVCRRNA